MSAAKVAEEVGGGAGIADFAINASAKGERQTRRFLTSS